MLDSMRRELNGQFKESLDAMTLNALLDAEGEWLLTEGETCSTETLEERLATVEKKLHEDYKAFFDAKEEHRLKVEKELEEESKKRKEVGVGESGDV